MRDAYSIRLQAVRPEGPTSSNGCQDEKFFKFLSKSPSECTSYWTCEFDVHLHVMSFGQLQSSVSVCLHHVNERSKFALAMPSFRFGTTLERSSLIDIDTQPSLATTLSSASWKQDERYQCCITCTIRARC